MIYSQSLIARPYAKVYILQYGDVLQLQDIENIKLTIAFFRRNHNFLSLVGLVNFSEEKQHFILKKLFNHFSLHISLYKIVQLLINHNRLTYFAQVLQDICCLYFTRHNILEVQILTAQELDKSKIEKFEMFFAKHSGKKIISRVQVDKSLIAGIRMQSDIYLWQYSIAARLKKLRQKLLIKG